MRRLLGVRLPLVRDSLLRMAYRTFRLSVCAMLVAGSILWWTKFSYLIDGGPPAGMFIMPCESGDFTNRIMIIIITRHGNRSTRPRGIETEELPFSRILRRKKDSRDDVFSLRRGRSSNVSILSFEVGSLLVISCRKPIVAPW